MHLCCGCAQARHSRYHQNDTHKMSSQNTPRLLPSNLPNSIILKNNQASNRKTRGQAAYGTYMHQAELGRNWRQGIGSDADHAAPSAKTTGRAGWMEGDVMTHPHTARTTPHPNTRIRDRTGQDLTCGVVSTRAELGQGSIGPNDKSSRQQEQQIMEDSLPPSAFPAKTPHIDRS
jgi:hypothetical protein